MFFFLFTGDSSITLSVIAIYSTLRVESGHSLMGLRYYHTTFIRKCQYIFSILSTRVLIMYIMSFLKRHGKVYSPFFEKVLQKEYCAF